MSMEKSMFGAFIDKYFKGTIGKLTELFNGKKKESELLYETMLDEEYSADLTWNSTSLNHSIVAADVVAMDSSLPLKKRGTIRTAAGDIAKIGIKYQMKEKAISDINVMKAKGQKEAEIARKILENVPRAIKGVKVRIEIMFQQALSTGLVLVTNEDNDGTGVRASFGYADSHVFHATAAKWSDSENAKPLDDIRQLINKANEDSDEIQHFYLSEMYFNYMRKTAQVKELVATANNQVIISSATLPQPGRSKTLEALRDEFNAEFHVINSSFKYELADGSQTSIKPWAQPNVVGVPSTKVGRLVYGTLAEDTNRVAGVTYEKSNFILVSQYSHNEPSLAEFTAAQALAMPVIDDGQSIYVLHADSTNVKLSVDPEALTFSAEAGTEKVGVHTEEDKASAETSDDWLTVSVRGKVVTVKAAANATGAQRTGSVVISAGGESKTVSVTQEGGE